MLARTGPELASPAQWLHLRQGWQTELQFPSHVSLGFNKGSTQSYYTVQTPHVSGSYPSANQSLVPQSPGEEGIRPGWAAQYFPLIVLKIRWLTARGPS